MDLSQSRNTTVTSDSTQQFNPLTCLHRSGAFWAKRGIKSNVFERIRILFHIRTWVRSHYILQDLSCQHPACSLCVALAGQKTIFPKSVLSSLIFASVCHCLSSCPSSFSLYALSHLLKASPSRLASSDVYHAPSMSVSVQNISLCTSKMLYPVYSNKARASVQDTL